MFLLIHGFCENCCIYLSLSLSHTHTQYIYIYIYIYIVHYLVSRDSERTASHVNYTSVKCLLVMPSVLQTSHREEESEPGHMLMMQVLCKK